MTSGSKTYGTPLTINQYLVVGESDEIPEGQMAYVFNKQGEGYHRFIWSDWADMLKGDMNGLRQQIESQIAGSRVIFLRASWQDQYYAQSGEMDCSYVKGFMVEAIVKNESGARLSGLEIVSIMMAAAFIAAIAAAIFFAAWVVWKIMSATPEALIPAVGIVILVLIGLFVLLMFGGSLGVSKSGVQVGGRKG